MYSTGAQKGVHMPLRKVATRCRNVVYSQSCLLVARAQQQHRKQKKKLFYFLSSVFVCLTASETIERTLLIYNTRKYINKKGVRFPFKGFLISVRAAVVVGYRRKEAELQLHRLKLNGGKLCAYVMEKAGVTNIPNVMGIQKQKMEEQGRRQLIIHWIQ